MKLFGSRRGGARTGKPSRSDNKEKSSGLHKGKKTLLIVLSVLFVIVLAICVFVAFFVQPPEPVLSSVGIEQTEHGSSEGSAENTTGMKEGYYNILLAGTDNDGLRTDTMMIARLDTVNHTVALMSVPRDTMIETANGKIAKLNSVFGANGCGHAGMQALMLELEKILGFMPSGYALVDLDVFVELVDAIGGVYFDVPQRMYHNDPTQDLLIDLEPGYQLLDGDKAMQLVRFRGYAQADLQRTQVQRQFIITVVKQCISVSNWNKVSDYIDIFARNVTSNFSVGNMLYFAQHLMQCDLDNMASYTLPGTDVWLDAAYYDLIDAEVAAIVEKDFNPYLD